MNKAAIKAADNTRTIGFFDSVLSGAVHGKPVPPKDLEKGLASVDAAAKKLDAAWTVKVLRAVRPLDVENDCVLAQYGAGQADGASVPAYRDEPKIPPDSTTATFAALRLWIDNWRWSGVPFYLRTGKRLPQKLAEITVRLKQPAHWMFPIEASEPLPPNTFTFRLQPDEGVFRSILAKQPGPGLCLRPVTMHFDYDRAFAIDRMPSAYEWLLLDAIQGDQTLFPRSDWIRQAWSIVDPLIRHYQDQIPLSYPAGSWGPQGGLLDQMPSIASGEEEWQP